MFYFQYYIYILTQKIQFNALMHQHAKYMFTTILPCTLTL